MFTLLDWRGMRERRSRQKTLKRLEPRRSLPATERKLQVLETLRDWGMITEDEYWERRGDLVPVPVPARTPR